MPYPLEPSAVEMRRLVDQAMERIVAHVTSLPDQPAHHLDGAEDLARSLREPLPERGSAYEELLDFLFDQAIPVSFNTAGPGYLAYIPGGGVFHAAVADFIAAAANRYVGVWLAAPALAELEMTVVRWFCEVVGLPPTSGGILTSGGSLANFSAIVAARHERLGEQFADGRLYVSDQVHHSVDKAALLAGFPRDAVRVLPSDDRFRLRIDSLEEAIAADRAAGRRPFLVVGSAGTTNTGAVDDLTAIADVAQREGLWFHADAAYGGFFMLSERGRTRLRGLSRADSVTLDPHKGLFLPYGTGSLLVRDPDTLLRAHQLDAAYMPERREREFVDFCHHSPELSRDFRGLRVWLPLKVFGAGAFRESLEEKLDLAAWAADRLRTMPDIHVLADPELSIVAFRLEPSGVPPEELNALNRRFLNGINARKRVYMTGTTVRGRFLLRICVLSFRTHRDRMEAALDDIHQAASEVLVKTA